MQKIYLDNAATTAIDTEVVDVMTQALTSLFGNPSSIHSHGREVRAAIESARKQVAKHLNCTPAEIFFTSGGTEADNMAIRNTVKDLNIQHVISATIEHHAVTHSIENLVKYGRCEAHYVNILPSGHVDMVHLEELLKTYPGALVSLMHANNEIGNVLDIKRVGELCETHKALFHCDTVQTIGHFNIDLSDIKVHFITCAAHKLHGPKGVGFIYISNKVKLSPFIHGGAQERNMRGGTENVYGILGLAKAIDLAYSHIEEHKAHILGLKNYFINKLKAEIKDIAFNGDISDENSLYTVLNVSFPPSDSGEMFLFQLDIAGISASGGSACSSGSDIGSHVLQALKVNPMRPAIRFSFSKYNTIAEIDTVMEKLRELMGESLVVA